MIRKLGVLLMFGVLTACAVGNRHRYDDVVATLPYSATESVAVLTVDQRPYVLDRHKTPQFVGISRGGYGNPFDITTESGKPLSDDVTHAIAASLHAKGFDTIELHTEVGDAPTKSIEAVTASGKSRGLVIVLREWKSDTYGGTALHYDVTVTVYDHTGTALASSSIYGKDDLGGNAFTTFNPPEHAKEVVPPAFKSKLEQLLTNPGIQAALSGRD